MARLYLRPSLVFMPILLAAIVASNTEYGEEDLSHLPIQTTNHFRFPIPIQDDDDNVRHPPKNGGHGISPSIRVHVDHWLPAARPPPAPPLILSHEQYLEQLHRQEGQVKTPMRKKECGFPVMTRRLFGSVMKRSSHFATNESEMEAKIKAEDDSAEQDALLASPPTFAAPTGPRAKRSDGSETHSGGCIAKRQWVDMGGDYFPRYVKSYHCTSSACDMGFGAIGECRGKHYTTKVLKRITPTDSTSVEDCDQTLPEALRVDWKLVSVTVTTCCECANPANQMFGLK